MAFQWGSLISCTRLCYRLGKLVKVQLSLTRSKSTESLRCGRRGPSVCRSLGCSISTRREQGLPPLGRSMTRESRSPRSAQGRVMVDLRRKRLMSRWRTLKQTKYKSPPLTKSKYNYKNLVLTRKSIKNKIWRPKRTTMVLQIDSNSLFRPIL